ncbi:MAG: leucine-rich repeat protein, partial [Lachnospiraceae bacterium]|nr:leucine-rich repeat protein [Lachnospiraceae bacterium]
ASIDGRPLYYMEEVEEETGNVIPVVTQNPDGTTTTVSQNEVVKVKRFHPCYDSSTYKSQWGDLPLEQFYYDKTATDTTDVSNLRDGDTTESDFAPTTTDNVKWVKGVPVAYIASEHVVASGSSSGIQVKWGFSSDTDTGVFSGAGNVVTLVTGDNLLGIGKNAFRGCSSLSGIQLGNGTTTIHNYAFADCINIRKVDIDLHANVSAIGEHAFYNCQGLLSFTLPIGVKKIGDGAFEGCISLQTVALTGEGYNVSLQEIGDHVFKDCTSLLELVFPSGVKQNNSSQFRLSLIEGCTSLRSVTMLDRTMTFSDDAGGSFKFADFVNQISDEFYFASYSSSVLHNTATEQSIAFKYLDAPYLYEKVVKELDNDGRETGKNITYRVDENNNLQEFEMDKGVKNVDIPRAIGPYRILTIGSESFQNNCYLEKITIPSSITSIASYAFQGCHNLKDVIFEEPINLTSIGAGAFNTQIVENGKKCDAAADGRTCVEVVNANVQPLLTFTGSVDPNAAPFVYAMDPSNTINRGTQKKTYITYFSGWPTNLTVQYNPDTDLNELVDYPRYSDLKTGSLSPRDTTLHGDSYPYLTSDQAKAATEAVSAYESYINGGGAQPTQDQMEIVNSALNIVIPNGVEGIAEGLFSGVGVSGNTVGQADNTMQSVQMEGVSDVPAYAFYGCQGLQTVIMHSSGGAGGDHIGDYAFGNCDDLTNVSLSDNVTELGLRPFKECQKLTYVEFNESPHFVCDNGIIYGLTDGAKSSIVECLETRGATGAYTIGASMVNRSELQGISSIQDEAFKGCLGVGDVNLSTSKVQEIPVSCFEDTTNLFSVEMPETTRTIREKAFKNSGVRSLTIPDSVSYIDSTAFTNEDGQINKNITISCSEGSAAETFANLYGLTLGEPLVKTFSVMFLDWDDTILSTQNVEMGADAVPPANPVRQGYTFTGWKPDYTNIARDMTIYAFYDRTLADLDAAKHTVRFIDWDDSVYNQQTVYDGEDAITPPAPERKGYNFTGWRQSYTNVKEDIDVYAEYEKIIPQT